MPHRFLAYPIILWPTLFYGQPYFVANLILWPTLFCGPGPNVLCELVRSNRIHAVVRAGNPVNRVTTNISLDVK
jgi:hypothetical protein